MTTNNNTTNSTIKGNIMETKGNIMETIIISQINDNDAINNVIKVFVKNNLSSINMQEYRNYLIDKVNTKIQALKPYQNSTSNSKIIIKARKDLENYVIIHNELIKNKNICNEILKKILKNVIKVANSLILQAILSYKSLNDNYSHLTIGFICSHLPSSLFKTEIRTKLTSTLRETVITYKHELPNKYKDIRIIHNSNLPTLKPMPIAHYTVDKYDLGIYTKLSNKRLKALQSLHSESFKLIYLTDNEIATLITELYSKDNGNSIRLEHQSQAKLWFYTYKVMQTIEQFYFSYKTVANGLRIYNNNTFHPNTNKVFRKMFVKSESYKIDYKDKAFIRNQIKNIDTTKASNRYYIRHLKRCLYTNKSNALVNLDATNQNLQLMGIATASPSLASYGGISLFLHKGAEVMSEGLTSQMLWWFEKLDTFTLLEDRLTYPLNITSQEVIDKVEYKDDVVIILNHGYNKVHKEFFRPTIVKLDLSNVNPNTTIKNILLDKLESVFTPSNSKYLLMTVAYNKSEYANCEGDYELRQEIKHVNDYRKKQKQQGIDPRKLRDWKDVINNTPTNRIPLKYILMLEGINIQDTQIKQYIYRGAVNTVSPLLFTIRDTLQSVYDGMETEEFLSFITIDGMEQIIPKYKQVSNKIIIPLLNGKSKQVTIYRYELTCEDDDRLKFSPLLIQGLDSYGVAYMINNSNTVITNHDSFYIPFTIKDIEEATLSYKQFLIELLDYRPFNKVHYRINGARINYRNLHQQELLTKEDILASQHVVELDL